MAVINREVIWKLLVEMCQSALSILCFLSEDNFDEESMTHNDT